MSVKEFLIYTDGASRGNPGPAAAAFVFVQNGVKILEQSFYLEQQTNNQAEYHAIIKALSEAKVLTKKPVTVFSDSELVIKQLTGDYRVTKSHLRTLRDLVFEEMENFNTVNFVHVSRQNYWIKHADKLCNQCLNKHT